MNRMLKSAAVGALLAGLASPIANAESTADKEGRICTTETVVGSHLPQRVCTTAAQREAMAKEAHVLDATRRKGGNPGNDRSSLR